jgi:hypothetical protein
LHNEPMTNRGVSPAGVEVDAEVHSEAVRSGLVWFDFPSRRIRKQERDYQSALLRDVFGNPLCSVAFDPAWRTSTVTALASQVYESRDFSAMPILADALQDAGCDSDDVLNHCRDGKQVHVRGCWVIDLVLGKE